MHEGQIAALMMTNPNTLGLFDENIVEIARLVHDVGGQLYYDGANANAIMGITRPGDMGFDVVHFNLHKTCSTPHGGGGPGAGPIGVRSISCRSCRDRCPRRGSEGYFWEDAGPLSIGRVRANCGQFPGAGARLYLHPQQRPRWAAPRQRERGAQRQLCHARACRSITICHSTAPACTSSSSRPTGRRALGVHALDIAKRLLDFGIHPPTIYFPLIVPEALMIEPTETETKETLDEFIAIMRQIAEEAERQPGVVLEAPHVTVVGRLDEALAARKPDLRWQPEAETTATKA